MRSLIPHGRPDISPYERPLTNADLEQFAANFSTCSVRAFGLPHVQVGEVMPVLRHYWKALYASDCRLLRRAPWLARYAAIRVISLTK